MEERNVQLPWNLRRAMEVEVDKYEKDGGFTYSNSIYIKHCLNMSQLPGVTMNGLEWKNGTIKIHHLHNQHVISIELNMNTDFFC